MSALPPIADICGAQADVRFVPKADIRLAVTEQVHSVTYCGSLSPQGDKGGLVTPFKRSSFPTIVLVVIFIVSIKPLVMSYAYEIGGVVRQT